MGSDGQLALVHEVLAAVEARLRDPKSLDNLTEVEADLLATVTAIGIIGNGGHMYWYEGKDERETVRTAAGFDRMGLSQAAAAMRQSLQVFPDGHPPPGIAERRAFLAQHSERLERDFDPPDRIVWDVAYDEAALRYIEARTSDLLAASKKFVKILASH